MSTRFQAPVRPGDDARGGAEAARPGCDPDLRCALPASPRSPDRRLDILPHGGVGRDRHSPWSRLDSLVVAECFGERAGYGVGAGCQADSGEMTLGHWHLCDYLGGRWIAYGDGAGGGLAPPAALGAPQGAAIEVQATHKLGSAAVFHEWLAPGRTWVGRLGTEVSTAVCPGALRSQRRERERRDTCEEGDGGAPHSPFTTSNSARMFMVVSMKARYFSYALGSRLAKRPTPINLYGSHMSRVT